MPQTLVILTAGDYQFWNTFEDLPIVQPCWSLEIPSGKALVNVKWAKLNPENGLVTYFCDTELEVLWRLCKSQKGWETHNTQKFLDDPQAQRAFSKSEARIEKVKREIKEAGG